MLVLVLLILARIFLKQKLRDTQHFIIELSDVKKAFHTVNVNKSQGPDNISGRLIKSCADELSPIFQAIFDKSLQTQHVPSLCKEAVVVPVPKSSRPKILNDFRHVALTSVVMKVFEKIIRNVIMKATEHQLDPMQFAYRPNRGVEDALLTLLNLILKHVESKGTFARLLFIDFSSAFNTTQPHILIKRLLEQFEIRKNLVGWILDFLTDRSQRVRINGVLSDPVFSSTGSPQGCVLSPLLFTLYTNMCQGRHENKSIIKYADLRTVFESKY